MAKIREALVENFPDGQQVQVGITEMYQCSEKEIIIISTGRSNNPEFGEVGETARTLSKTPVALKFI